MKMSWQQGLLVATAIAVSLILSGANIVFGDLNQDEGWYLYAARQIGKGLLPYKDFFFTQGPVTPYVFAATSKIWGSGGLLGARCLNALFGWGAAVLSGWLAWRLSSPRVRFFTAFTAFALVAGNVYQSYFTAIIKTYSVAALFLAAALLALTWVRGAAGGFMAALAGLLLSLATGARLSLGVTIPVAGIYLLWRRAEVGRWRWLFFGAGAALGIAGVIGPWLLLCGDQFRFAMGFHSSRSGGGLLAALLFKAGFLSRSINAYFVAFALLGAGLTWRMARWTGGGKADSAAAADNGRPSHFLMLLSGMLGAVILLHLTAPFPYDDYQVPVYPILAVVTAVIGWALVDGIAGMDTRHAVTVQWIVLAVIVAQAWTSQANQAWFVYGRDRLWWLRKERPDIVLLQDVARRLNTTYPGKGVLLTQDTYLAVEAGWSVPEGLEMGPFSYFPGLSVEEAKRYRVLCRASLSNLLETCEAPVAAFSGYGLAIQSPSTDPVPEEERKEWFSRLARRYERIEEVPAFGQAHTVLSIWKLRKSPAGPEKEDASL